VTRFKKTIEIRFPRGTSSTLQRCIGDGRGGHHLATGLRDVVIYDIRHYVLRDIIVPQGPLLNALDGWTEFSSRPREIVELFTSVFSTYANTRVEGSATDLAHTVRRARSRRRIQNRVRRVLKGKREQEVTR